MQAQCECDCVSEMTAIYVAARSVESQQTIRVSLDEVRRNTNRSLVDLSVWPSGNQHSEGHMFRSPHLFIAILNNHRESIKPGVSYFWDEVQFYSDIIDTMLGWLSREIGACSRHGHLFGLLHSYSYLMGAVAYLGAEQALCAVFHSVICFSHRETFYYANYSFSGEAIFRLYRQSYTGSRRPDGWRTASHRSFFPELYGCRQEVLTDLDYIGMSPDPSLCNHARKNETRFHEAQLLSEQEVRLLVEEVEESFASLAGESRLEGLLSVIALVSTVTYVVLVHLFRCIFIRYSSARLRRERKRSDHLQDQRFQQYHYLPQHQPNHHHHHQQQHLQLTLSMDKCNADATAANAAAAAAGFTNDLHDNHKAHRNFTALKVASV